MSHFHGLYETFAPLKDDYDLEKNAWNAALRVMQYGNNNLIMTLTGFILPSSASPFATSVNAFTRPDYPFMPYSPPEYNGPDFSVWNTLTEAEEINVQTCVGVVCETTPTMFYP